MCKFKLYTTTDLCHDGKLKGFGRGVVAFGSLLMGSMLSDEINPNEDP